MAPRNVKPKIGIVASAGGLNCLATLGIVNFIKENNIEIAACAGSSGGAFALAAYSCGIDLRAISGERISKELKQSFFDPDKKSLMAVLMRAIAFIFGFGSKSFLTGIESMGYCRGDKLLALLEEKFGNLSFKNSLIPLYIPAYNITERQTNLFHKDGLNPTIAQAIRMSSSIPLIFRPYAYNQSLYWDAGVQSSLPVKELLDNEPDINFLILVDTVSGNDLIIDHLNQPLSLLHAINDVVIESQNRQVHDSIKYATEKLGDNNVLILTPPNRRGWSAFDKIPEIVQDGYNLTKNAFKYNKKLQAAFDDYDK